MTNDQIDQILGATFDDQRLSRSERRALKQLVESPPELRPRFRSRAFAIAPALAGGAPLELVLTWLEDVVKALADLPPVPPSIDARVVFAPHDDVPAHIIAALGGTRTRADLAVFTITDDRLARAVLDAHLRGVAVRILSDNDKSNDLGSDIERLAQRGVPVRIDRTPVHMHHKFALLDRHTLLNGSYNWTRSAADDNCENLVICRDEALVAQFEREFERLWHDGVPLP